MNKRNRFRAVLIATALALGIAAGPSLAANTESPTLPRDGSKFVKENRFTQADREAVAARRAKGTQNQNVGAPSPSGGTTQSQGGPTK